MQFDPYQKSKKIKDVMSPLTLSLESTATASDAAKIMETRNLEAVVINRLMSYPLISINQDAEISDARSLMEKNKIKRLPVVSDNTVLGIVTMSDLID